MLKSKNNSSKLRRLKANRIENIRIWREHLKVPPAQNIDKENSIKSKTNYKQPSKCDNQKRCIDQQIKVCRYSNQ
jgi:hypothetical protein